MNQQSNNDMYSSLFRTRNIVAGVIAVAALLVTPFMVTNLWENLDANEIMVVQSPVDGTLSVYTDPGVKWQGFGKVTKYPRRGTYEFMRTKQEDDSKKLQFNDGGHGYLSGAISWEMPLDPKSIIAIHKTFGNAEGVQQQAVARMIDAAVYLAGPLMSSTESSGERRAELVQYINDQAENGVYVTRVVEKDVKDSVTGQEKHVTGTEIVRDDHGQPRRQQGSMLNDFNIKLLPLSISALDYDDIVKNQIKQRQEATTQVQIAQANAKRAQQDAITAAAQGEAAAAKAKWEQEVVKAKAVTLAQQEFEVAQLAAKTAEQYKKEQILKGEGEAARKQLVMQADGALDKKLAAYEEVQKVWADAFKNYGGALVPSVIMGQASGTSGSASGNAAALVDMLTAKTARDLGLNMEVSGQAETANKKK